MFNSELELELRARTNLGPGRLNQSNARNNETKVNMFLSINLLKGSIVRLQIV